MLPDSVRLLGGKGYLPLATFADAIGQRYAANEATCMTDVVNQESVEETLEAILAPEYQAAAPMIQSDLKSLATEMTRPSGLVHHTLRNGHVLCSTRIPRVFTDEDTQEDYIETVTVRFVSNDRHVIKAFRWAPMRSRIESALRRFSETQLADARRVPGLIADIGPLRAQLHRSMQQELPLPEEDDE